jgi:hypothetical protein
MWDGSAVDMNENMRIADELIATKPADVIAVPFGWTEDVEANRNTILAQLSCNTSVLPSVIFHVQEKMVDIGVWVDDHVELTMTRLPEHYEEIRVFDMPKPWNWTDINNIIADTQTSTKSYPDFKKVYRWNIDTLSWEETS